MTNTVLSPQSEVNSVWVDSQVGYAICYGPVILYQHIYSSYEEADMALHHLFIPGIGVRPDAYAIQKIEMKIVKENTDGSATTITTASA